MPDPFALLGPVVYAGIDVHELAEGGLRTAIVGMNAKFETALLEQRDGVDWIAAWRGQHHVRAAVDTSRLGGLILQQRGIGRLTAYTAAQMADATPSLRHVLKAGVIKVVQRSEALDKAVKAGRRRFLTGGIRWLWSADAADIAPLIALTLAFALAANPKADPTMWWDDGPFGPRPEIQRFGRYTFPTFTDREGR